MVAPLVITVAICVRYENILVVDVISSIFLSGCISLVAYFYVKAYFAVGIWSRTQIRSINVLLKGKLESKVAHTPTFWLTVFFGVSQIMPVSLVHLFQGALPFFPPNFHIRWAEKTLQLNSLFNPLLYSYENCRLRKATLELLRCRNRPAIRSARQIRPRGYSVASLDVEKLQNEQTSPQLLRPESLGALVCLDTFRQRRKEAVTQRPMSAPSRVASDEIFTQQRNQLIVTVQIENAPELKSIQRKTELPKTSTRLGRSRRHICGKIMRSRSLNEHSFALPAKCHRNATQKKD